MVLRKKNLILVPLFISMFMTGVPAVKAWGDEGHRYINRVAAQNLPADMPLFFKQASPRLEFLGPEPDRWRDSREVFAALREANSPDHFINIDKPENFIFLPNTRYKYIDWLRAQGKDAKEIGFLPYAIVEGYQKIQVLFRLWRDPKNSSEQDQIEQNIIYYAGVVGHFVADGSQPLHTTIHYNGWSGSDNPDYHTRDPLHWRFEGEYVRAQIKADDFSGLVKPAARLRDPFTDTMNFLFASFQQVKPIYEMDKVARWDDKNRHADSRLFVARRLAAGSQMLANLWYTAWLDSGTIKQE